MQIVAIKELPKDDYSKYAQENGLDVCPVELSGLDLAHHQNAIRDVESGRYSTLVQIKAESDEPTQSVFRSLVHLIVQRS